MYNRYIPQSDGSFRKNRMPEPQRPTAHPEQKQTHEDRPIPQPHPGSYTPNPGGSVTGFLRNLLPKEFDTGDLIVVLLLLLMAERREEDQNTALLTLALYFIM